MEDTVQEGAQCLICHESLLSQSVGALKCGHVYHYACFQQWLLCGKGNCPNCRVKTNPDEIRILEFEVAEVQPESYEEVRRLECASAEERAGIREELQFEQEAAELRASNLEEELSEHRIAAQERKRARTEQEEESKEKALHISKLLERLEKKFLECTQVQTHLDAEETKQVRKLPISKPREDDPDVLEERRKLRVVRVPERSKQLHEALVSARKLEAEYGDMFEERQHAVEQAEVELKKLRRNEVALRRALSERREAEHELEACNRHGGTQAHTLHKQEAELRRTSMVPAIAEVPNVAGVSVARGSTPGVMETDDGDADADLLYGGGPLRRSGSGGMGGSGFLLRTQTSAHAPSSSVVASIAQVTTPARKQSAIQALFSKRVP